MTHKLLLDMFHPMRIKLYIILILAYLCSSCSVVQTMREKHYNIVTAKSAYYRKPANAMEVTRRALYKTVMSKDYIPQTDLEKATYAMKDSISDYNERKRQKFFKSHWCNIHDYRGRKLCISENDSLPECFYLPVFAAILYSPRSRNREDEFCKETGFMLMVEPNRINEIIALASQMRHDLKYWILTEVIDYYIRQFYKSTMFISGIKYTDIPLYEYIKYDDFLREFFISSAQKRESYILTLYRAYEDIEINKEFLDSLYLRIPDSQMIINLRFF